MASSYEIKSMVKTGLVNSELHNLLWRFSNNGVISLPYLRTTPYLYLVKYGRNPSAPLKDMCFTMPGNIGVWTLLVSTCM